jgi:hypothetical protein
MFGSASSSLAFIPSNCPKCERHLASNSRMDAYEMPLEDCSTCVVRRTWPERYIW